MLVVIGITCDLWKPFVYVCYAAGMGVALTGSKISRLVPTAAPTAAPTPTSKSAITPVPTKIYGWTQIQRDYHDERIPYDQAVELAVGPNPPDGTPSVNRLSSARDKPRPWARIPPPHLPLSSD